MIGPAMIASTSLGAFSASTAGTASTPRTATPARTASAGASTVQTTRPGAATQPPDMTGNATRRRGSLLDISA